MSKETDEAAFPKEIASQLISVTEAAQASGLTTSYIRRLLRTGVLEGVKVGEAWLTSRQAIQDYLTTERRPGPKPK